LPEAEVTGVPPRVSEVAAAAATVKVLGVPTVKSLPLYTTLTVSPPASAVVIEQPSVYVSWPDGEPIVPDQLGVVVHEPPTLSEIVTLPVGARSPVGTTKETV
jgi:hypothetical protein